MPLNIRGGSRAAAKSKMERFVIIVNGSVSNLNLLEFVLNLTFKTCMPGSTLIISNNGPRMGTY